MCLKNLFVTTSLIEIALLWLDGRFHTEPLKLARKPDVQVQDLKRICRRRNLVQQMKFLYDIN